MSAITFDQLNLSPDVLKAVTTMGFSVPTPIQAQSIPLILEGHDVTGQAQTGTGKTAAFAIPAIQNIDTNQKNVQTLVLCPTRELAIQVSEEIKKLAQFSTNVRVLPVYGGASIEVQFRELKKGVHIVCGTPGRILDHIKRKTLNLSHVQMVILDEADEMLDMGFREDIETILEQMPEERQTVLFSATLSKPILEITKKYQKDPQYVKVVKDELTVSGISQRYFELKEHDKPAVLERLVKLYQPKLCLVFTNTKRKADELVSILQQTGFPAEALHGDLKQAQRNHVMSRFRLGIVQVLIATDVAARGLDVENVEMVVNYDIPLESEFYVHRIGRTGRAGRSGHAFSFVTRGDVRRLRDIEKYSKATIIKEEIPSTKAIDERRKNDLLKKIIETIETGALSPQIALVEELHEHDFSTVDIAAALLKIEMDRQGMNESSKDTIQRISFDGDGRGERSREKSGSREKGKRESKGRDRDRDGGAERKPRKRSDEKMTRLFLNLGRKNHISPRDVVGAIAGESGVAGNRIGEIDIYDKFTFVNVPEEDASRIIKAINKSNIKGYKVRIEEAE